MHGPIPSRTASHTFTATLQLITSMNTYVPTYSIFGSQIFWTIIRQNFGSYHIQKYAEQFVPFGKGFTLPRPDREHKTMQPHMRRGSGMTMDSLPQSSFAKGTGEGEDDINKHNK